MCLLHFTVSNLPHSLDDQLSTYTDKLEVTGAPDVQLHKDASQHKVIN